MSFSPTSKFFVLLELLALKSVDLKMKKYLRQRRVNIQSEGKIYVDSLQSPAALVALAIFLPVLSKSLGASIASYRFMQARWYSIFTQRVIHKFSVLRAIGADDINLQICGKNVNAVFTGLFKKITNGRELLDFTYRGILIGDLIYDTYLNESHQPTLNLDDPELLSHFADACFFVDNWIKLVENNSVSAVCVGHTVYKNGIPARVCLAYGIPAYQVNLGAIYSLRKDRQLAHFDFLDYPVDFRKLAESDKQAALNMAQLRLKQRIYQGESPELSYMPVSAYKPISGMEPRVLQENEKFKVLIATHDFFDSPHCQGETIYEDFYIWLYALAELSLKTDFEWYVKNHPYLRGYGKKIIDELISSYPNLQLIPPETSHQQIVREGISAVVTVYGSIGVEYAALGLKTVNACATNPHCEYSFNYNPRSIQEFEDIVLSLDKRDLKINLDEVHEYFYMHHLRWGPSWAFQDTDFDFFAGDLDNPRDNRIYAYFLSKSSNSFLESLAKQLQICISQDNYRLDSAINRI
jgi:hypothetical protein